MAWKILQEYYVDEEFLGDTTIRPCRLFKSNNTDYYISNFYFDDDEGNKHRIRVFGRYEGDTFQVGQKLIFKQNTETREMIIVIE